METYSYYQIIFRYISSGWNTMYCGWKCVAKLQLVNSDHRNPVRPLMSTDWQRVCIEVRTIERNQIAYLCIL